jgi:hypothetical protein
VFVKLYHEQPGCMNELLTEARTLFEDLVGQGRALDALDGLPLEMRTGRKTTSVTADLHGELPGRTILPRLMLRASTIE